MTSVCRSLWMVDSVDITWHKCALYYPSNILFYGCNLLENNFFFLIKNPKCDTHIIFRETDIYKFKSLAK